MINLLYTSPAEAHAKYNLSATKQVLGPEIDNTHRLHIHVSQGQKNKIKLDL